MTKTTLPARLLAALLPVCGGVAHAQPPAELQSDPHVREELGVNEFTSPEIKGIIEDLRVFDPAKLRKLRRDPTRRSYTNRAQLALNVGQAIAEGFIGVATRDRGVIEPVGRALMRYGDALGVGDKIKRRGSSFIELAATNQWDELEKELVAAQSDVEEALMALRDEEVAHLISLGGWLRGVEAGSRLLADDYNPELARSLDRAGLVDYFVDRVSTLDPDLRALDLFKKIEARLAEIRRILINEEPPTRDEAERIAEITGDLNRDIAEPIREK